MKKHSKKSLSAVLGITLSLTVIAAGGCGNNATGSTSDTPSVNHVFREIEAQKYITPAKEFAGGDGTEANPYQISNAAELAHLAELCNSDAAEAVDSRAASYLLTDDIILNERSDGADWSKTAPEYAWTPIGLSKEFQGIFDGGGHKVVGMYINEDISDKTGYASYGMFGENQGTIKNVNVEGAYICVSGYTAVIGGIAGENALQDSIVENCTVDADIYLYDAKCGGVVGDNTGAVSSCKFNGSVKAMQEDAINKTGGGIVGYNSGKISKCENDGEVICDNTSGNVGGIVGSHYGGTVADSVNNGKISGAETAGGIAGTVFLVSGGGALEEKTCDIVNCVNFGSVETENEYAGGIAGRADNDWSKYPIHITDCINEGTAVSSKKAGGIVGLLTTDGDIVLSGCDNTADIESDVAGGIVASASLNFGNLTITGCENSGSIKAAFSASGILSENNILGLDLSSKLLNITVEDCKNTGNIETDKCGGGITGALVCAVEKSVAENIKVSYENDVNLADISCNNDNCFVGGIAANIGIEGAEFSLSGCASSGKISFKDIPPDEETAKLEAGNRIELSRMSGGIVGRIGSGIYLSTTGDKVSEDAVNNDSAKIRLENCLSNMTFDAPAEDKYTYDDDGTPIIFNRFGGIVGYLSGDKGFEFAAAGCEYANTERGLGNEGLPDIGVKADSGAIASKINAMS